MITGQNQENKMLYKAGPVLRTAPVIIDKSNLSHAVRRPWRTAVVNGAKYF
jgi:hypothetical protein